MKLETVYLVVMMVVVYCPIQTLAKDDKKGEDKKDDKEKKNKHEPIKEPENYEDCQVADGNGAEAESGNGGDEGGGGGGSGSTAAGGGGGDGSTGNKRRRRDMGLKENIQLLDQVEYPHLAKRDKKIDILGPPNLAKQDQNTDIHDLPNLAKQDQKKDMPDPPDFAKQDQRIEMPKIYIKIPSKLPRQKGTPTISDGEKKMIMLKLKQMLQDQDPSVANVKVEVVHQMEGRRSLDARRDPPKEVNILPKPKRKRLNFPLFSFEETNVEMVRRQNQPVKNEFVHPRIMKQRQEQKEKVVT